MGKVYSWFLKTDNNNREQYAYIIEPSYANSLLNAGKYTPDINDVNAKPYVGDRLNQVKVDIIRKWAKGCSINDYILMFNKLKESIESNFTDINIGDYKAYVEIPVEVESLRGPQGRGIKQILFHTTGTSEYDYYKIIFDDGTYDIFTMPRGRDGAPGKDGAAPDKPILHVTKTIYASGVKENGDIEVPEKPKGGDYDFIEMEFSSIPLGWSENNANLTPPIFASTREFFSNDDIKPWSEPLQITGDDGKPGTDGVTTEFIYCRTNENLNNTLVDDDTLKYFEYFNYYEWTDKGYKPVSNINGVDVNDVDILDEIPLNKTKTYLKIWGKPDDIDNNVTEYNGKEEDISGLEEQTKYIKIVTAEKNVHYYIWGEYKGEHVPNKWTDTPSGVDENNKTEWCAIRRCNTKTKKWGAWSKPQIWSKYGEKGEDGDGIEYIFYLGDATPPLNPTPQDFKTNLAYQSKDEEWIVPIDYQYTNINGESVSWTIDDTWVDESPNVSAEKMYLWVTSRKYRKFDGKYSWGAFSEPALWSKFGESGKSGIVVRELYKLTKSSSEKPNKPSNSSYSDWSVGFPSAYNSGENVVWGTRAELDVDTNQFAMGYNLVYPEPDDSITGINTLNVDEAPNVNTEHEEGYKYLCFNNMYYYWDNDRSTYVKYEDNDRNIPKDSLSETDKKYLVVQSLPTTKQEGYEFVKYLNTYYVYSGNGYLPVDGVPNDIANYIIKGINTFSVNNALPIKENGYKYILFRNEYYTWSESSWCEPYLVTGVKGDPASPVDYTVDYFLYYDVNITPKAPSNGQVITSERNNVTGETINGVIDKWVKLPSLSDPNEETSRKRWYKCTGIVKAENSTTTWGDVFPVGGRDGENGKMYEKRYCVTYSINSPSVNSTDRTPVIYYNNKKMGWFSLDDPSENKEFNDLLIDGCPPMGGAVWEIQAEIDPISNKLITTWTTPKLHSGYPGERGPEGPAGRRGVTGIPGASLNVLYCLGTFNEKSEKESGYFFDEVIVDNEKKYYSNGYFGETPVVEPNNDKLKNWFKSPPATEYIVVTNEDDFVAAKRYSNLGRVVDKKEIITINNVTVNRHNFYLIHESNIPYDVNDTNLYKLVYGDKNFDKYTKIDDYEFIEETCYYRWVNNNGEGKYELINELNSNITSNEVKYVSRVPSVQANGFNYVKIVNYYKWVDICYELYNEPYNAGNYKIEYMEIKTDVDGDENAKLWQPYIWSTQGSKQEAYLSIYGYVGEDAAYHNYDIPSGILDINAVVVDNIYELEYKNSKYKYLIEKSTGLFFKWNDTLNDYVKVSTSNTFVPSDLFTDIFKSNVIEYVKDGNNTPGVYVKMIGKPSDATNQNTTIENEIPSTNSGTKYIKVDGEYYRWFALGVKEIPSFNLSECEYLQQTIGNTTLFYQWNAKGVYEKCANTPINATRENTLVITPDTTVDLLPNISTQYSYFKESALRNNHIAGREEHYYIYYSWQDLTNEKLEIKTIEVDWSTPFRLQGSNGLVTAGNRGQVVYPRGVYNSNDVYVATSTKAPYVLDPNDGLFYVYNVVDKPWVGVLPTGYETILEEPSDVNNLNTLIITNREYIPNWYQKSYDYVQKYTMYEWDENLNEYIDISTPVDANENTTILDENTGIELPKEYLTKYIIYQGKYYEWLENSYTEVALYQTTNINIKTVDNIINIKDDSDFLLCNGLYYKWDDENSKYIEITSILDDTNAIEIYSLDKPKSLIAGYKYVKIYCYYTWVNNAYKITANINHLTDKNYTSLTVLPKKKLGYKYFNIPENIDGNKTKNVYYNWDFEKGEYKIVSSYKYGINGVSGDWIPEQGAINTPATNYANAIENNVEPAWVRFEHFNALYASIGIIANGMIGSSVYNNEFMYSQQGKTLDKDGKRVASSNYEDFLSAYYFDGNIGNEGAWTYNGYEVNDKSVNPYDDENKFWPNVCINFKTGQMWLSCGSIKFGAFASENDDDNDTNIATQDIIDEMGSDKKLTPKERSSLRDSYLTFYTEHEYVQALYSKVNGEPNAELSNAYDKAYHAYTAHTTVYAIEKDELPINEYKDDDNKDIKYIKYKGDYYKWDATTTTYRYVNVDIDTKHIFDSYDNIDTKQTGFVLVKNDTVSDNGEILHYGGFYYIKEDGVIERVEAKISSLVPSEEVTKNSDNFIIIKNNKNNTYGLFKKTFIGNGAYIKINKEYEEEKVLRTKIFTSGDTIDIYTTGDKAYSGISHYYLILNKVLPSINSTIYDGVSGLTGTLDNWAADNFLSPAEIKLLKEEYKQFITESGLTQEHALIVGITGDSHEHYSAYTDYTNACEIANDTFNYYINASTNNDVITGITITTDSNDYTNYNNIASYYAKRKTLSEVINSLVSSDMTEIRTTAEKAINDAVIALGTLSAITEDNIISISEIPILNNLNSQIETEFTIIENEYNGVTGLTNNDIDELFDEYETASGNVISALTVLIEAIKTDWKDNNNNNNNNNVINIGIPTDSKEYNSFSTALTEYNTAKTNLLNGIQTVIINNQNVLSDKLSTFDYLTKTFESGKTEIKGGLILSNFIGVQDDDNKLQAFINGGDVYKDDEGKKILCAGIKDDDSSGNTYFYNWDNNIEECNILSSDNAYGVITGITVSNSDKKLKFDCIITNSNIEITGITINMADISQNNQYNWKYEYDTENYTPSDVSGKTETGCALEGGIEYNLADKGLKKIKIEDDRIEYVRYGNYYYKWNQDDKEYQTVPGLNPNNYPITNIINITLSSGATNYEPWQYSNYHNYPFNNTRKIYFNIKHNGCNRTFNNCIYDSEKKCFCDYNGVPLTFSTNAKTYINIDVNLERKEIDNVYNFDISCYCKKSNLLEQYNLFYAKGDIIYNNENTNNVYINYRMGDDINKGIFIFKNNTDSDFLEYVDISKYNDKYIQLKIDNKNQLYKINEKNVITKGATEVASTIIYDNGLIKANRIDTRGGTITGVVKCKENGEFGGTVFSDNNSILNGKKVTTEKVLIEKGISITNETLNMDLLNGEYTTKNEYISGDTRYLAPELTYTGYYLNLYNELADIYIDNSNINNINSIELPHINCDFKVNNYYKMDFGNDWLPEIELCCQIFYNNNVTKTYKSKKVWGGNNGYLDKNETVTFYLYTDDIKKDSSINNKYTATTEGTEWPNFITDLPIDEKNTPLTGLTISRILISYTCFIKLGSDSVYWLNIKNKKKLKLNFLKEKECFNIGTNGFVLIKGDNKFILSDEKVFVENKKDSKVRQIKFTNNGIELLQRKNDGTNIQQIVFTDDGIELLADKIIVNKGTLKKRDSNGSITDIA